MDIKLFTEMLKDKRFTNYKQLKHKYGEDDFYAFLRALKDLFYKELPLLDFSGKNLVFVDGRAAASDGAVKLLLQPQSGDYGKKAAEDEIISTSAIESIDLSRDSVRRILKGMSPADEQEHRIMGLKRGLDFIADRGNRITEENLYTLYMTAVGEYLEDENKLSPGGFYRDGAVFVMSDRVEHSGLPHQKVPLYMRSLVAFADANDGINDLVKAAIIHFYIAFVHPYFDGNGRIARLVHLWFLIQRGYRSALFIPFSSRIEKSRKAYYDAFTLIEENRKESGVTDVTPFVLYFINEVYNEIGEGFASSYAFVIYDEALKEGRITEKEAMLWKFILSNYGTGEFSTKMLEKDFGNAAYATVRSFVIKFEKLGLLSSRKYGRRVKYKVL